MNSVILENQDKFVIRAILIKVLYLHRVFFFNDINLGSQLNNDVTDCKCIWVF